MNKLKFVGKILFFLVFAIASLVGGVADWIHFGFAPLVLGVRDLDAPILLTVGVTVAFASFIPIQEEYEEMKSAKSTYDPPEKILFFIFGPALILIGLLSWLMDGPLPADQITGRISAMSYLCSPPAYVIFGILLLMSQMRYSNPNQ